MSLNETNELEEEAYEEDERDQEIREAAQLLPAWFTSRMMYDVRAFGLLTINGTVIGIQCIDSISQASDQSIWIDVTLLDTNYHSPIRGIPFIVAPTSRLTASINVNHIVAAFELADT